MRIRKSDFVGLGQVFRFTLTQMLKNRANLISAIILIVFAIAAFPLSGLLAGATQDMEATEIACVYVENQTPFALDLATLPQDAAFSNTTFAAYNAQALGAKDVHATLTDAGEEGYQITLTCQAETDVADWELDSLYQLLSQSLLLSRIVQSGATSEQLAIAGANVTVSTMRLCRVSGASLYSQRRMRRRKTSVSIAPLVPQM